MQQAFTRIDIHGPVDGQGAEHPTADGGPGPISEAALGALVSSVACGLAELWFVGEPDARFGVRGLVPDPAKGPPAPFALAQQLREMQAGGWALTRLNDVTPRVVAGLEAGTEEDVHTYGAVFQRLRRAAPDIADCLVQALDPGGGALHLVKPDAGLTIRVVALPQPERLALVLSDEPTIIAHLRSTDVSLDLGIDLPTTSQFPFRRWPADHPNNRLLLRTLWRLCVLGPFERGKLWASPESAHGDPVARELYPANYFIERATGDVLSLAEWVRETGELAAGSHPADERSFEGTDAARRVIHTLVGLRDHYCELACQLQAIIS